MPNSDIMEIFETGDLDALDDLLGKNSGDESDSDDENTSRESFDPNERNHHTRPTYLHVAVRNGYDSLVERLLELDDIDPNATADYVDGLELFTETTPLHLAIHLSNKHIAKLLINHKDIDVNESGSDPDGLSPLQYAFYRKEQQFVEMLIAANAKKLSLSECPLPWEKRTLMQILEEDDQFEDFTLNELLEMGAIDSDSLDATNDDGYTCLEIAARDGDIKLAKLLISYGAEVTESAYKMAKKNVKALLDYRPGRNQQTIYEYCLENYDLAQRKRLVLDYEDTTDADSSDDEDYADAGITLTSDEKAQVSKKREKLVVAHNKGNKTAKEKLQILTFRGFHHDPSYFSQEKRQESRADLTAGKPAVSYATFKASGYDADDEVDETSKRFTAAHEKVKKFFKDMRGKPDCKETDAPTRNKKAFENLYFRFVQAYVENYNQLFNEGTVEKDFGFTVTHNPAVSTTYLPDKAMKYASGMRNQKGADIHRLNPHYRRATGKAKHPHLGFTDVFAMDIDYVQTNGAHILELVSQGKIGIGHIKQFECEILFESMIPGQYHVHREVFSLPNFDKNYQDEYQEKYGLTKLIFNRFKERVRDREYPCNSNGELEILNDLIEQIVAHLGMKLKENMEAKFYKQNPANPKYAVFPFRDGELKTMAVSPKEKDKWRKVDHAAAAAIVDDLNDAFADLDTKDDKKVLKK